jgi:hypothetical protein
MMYHLQLINIVAHRHYQSYKSDQWSRWRTCDVDPNRIHGLIEECPAAAPPLVDGDTPGSNIEGEKFNQVSCLHPSPLCQRMVQ